jgi:prolipoprotein diacylglyceryl transferase
VTTTVLAYIPSPSQGVWHLGVIPIRAYALFIIVGIIAALIIGDRRWEARGGEPGVIYDIALWAVPFGLIGGRLYHVMTDWRTYFGDDGAGLSGALKIWDGGLGIWGAVALGGVGAWIGCRKHGIPLPAFGDAIAPGIVLAQAIGRLGNYFNQELYGRPTTLPWGLEIYERRNASGALDTLNGVSTGQLVEVVHPTFLYELLWNLLVFAALIYIDRRFKIGHGRLFAMYVAGYCVGRFWVELMRNDTATHIAGIRINSFTSTFVFIGAVVYIMVAPKGREDPATLRGKPRADEHEDTSVEEFVKELTAVGATTGIVAAAKVAGEAEDEDAKAAGGDAAKPDEPKPDEPEPDEAETDAEPAEGLGSVEGDEVLEAEEAAPEAHEAAVEGVAEAEALADEAAAEADDASGDVEPEAEESEAETVEVAEEPDTAEDETEAPAGGLGAVEGEEVAAAEEAAPEAHEAAVEGVAEAEALTDEVAAEAEEPEPEADEAELDTDAQGAQEPEAEAEEAEPEAEAEEPAEEPEPEAGDESDEAEEPKTAASEDEEPVDDGDAGPAAEATATQTTANHKPEESAGGRLRRWVRNRISR